MRYLRANTQVIVIIGPFVDVGDGFTPETGVSLSTADEAELLKHGSTSVVDISGATWAAVTSADGHYALTLTTSHTDTEGLLRIVIQDDSVCLPVKEDFMVLSEAAWDSMFLAKDDGYMDVNIKTIGRTDTQETEASNLEAACSNYSATRGLSGTALPAAAADAAGGLPISDGGAQDFDAMNAGVVGLVAALIAATSSVNDVSASTTEFDSNLTDADDFWNGQRLVFLTGNLAGQSRIIADFANTSGHVTVESAFTAAPDNASSFSIIPIYARSVADIQSGLATSSAQTTAQNDLDILTGSDGVTLATTQANYAPAVAGDAMALTSGERTSLATVLEAAMLDEGDASALLAAIAAKVEEFLINEGDATATLAAIATAVWAAGTRTLTANTNLNDPTAAAIADAVWDEARSGHVAAGSFGQGVASVQGDVTGNVDGTVAGVTPYSGTPPTAAAIADQVWDEATSGHVTAGSFGKLASDVDTNVTTLLSRITSALFNGITSLAEWLGLIAGKQTGDATALTEIKATGAGSGTYDPTTDSNEAIRDNSITAAQVNAEVVDALNVDTYAEPSQGTPAATSSLATKIGYLFKAWRNKKTQTATTHSLYNDDATTVDHKATVSDDGTTFTQEEMTAGP